MQSQKKSYPLLRCIQNREGNLKKKYQYKSELALLILRPFNITNRTHLFLLIFFCFHTINSEDAWSESINWKRQIGNP